MLAWIADKLLWCSDPAAKTWRPDELITWTLLRTCKKELPRELGQIPIYLPTYLPSFLRTFLHTYLDKWADPLG